ncbi:hypothetical protein P7C71_g4065, partial [Lecanoromycetidae sp. Uapishka_2]
MSRIRVGLIGLSARAKTSWASSAHLPYLQSSQNKYTITALCNSSVDAAESAIQAYKLPASTKAYGNPEDLANDQEIDLIVCTTRVDVHYQTIKPSLERGKDVYCEWPLASTLTDAEELNALARKSNAKTIIGLQGELSPIILKVKSLIERENRIGKVLSSSVIASEGTKARDTLSEGLRYFTQKDVGGNLVTIGLGHMLDFVEFVLGELSACNSQLDIQRRQVPILGRDGGVIETVTTDVADHIMLQGKLYSGAPLSLTFRRGPPFKDTPGLIWSISGEKGEIRVTAAGSGLQAIYGGTIMVQDFATDEIEDIQWHGQFEDLPAPARNVAAMYEAFADKKTGLYQDFEHAVIRHRQIEDILKGAGD